MTIAYVNKNASVGKSTTLTGVTAGNLIVCMLQFQDATSTPTLSDGSSTFSYATVKLYGAQRLRIAYCLASVASGSVTYTWTASGGGGHTTHVFEMSHDGTLALDTIDAQGTGTDATAESANETSTETSMVAFGAAGLYDSDAITGATLDGVAVDQLASARDTSYLSSAGLSMRVMSNPGTYNSVITFAAAAEGWVADLIAFKEVAAAGGTILPQMMAHEGG